MNGQRRCGMYIQWSITQPSKNEILPFAMTWMELEGIMLSKMSQSEKELYDLMHMWNLRNKTGSQGKEEKIKQNKIRMGDKPEGTLESQERN